MQRGCFRIRTHDQQVTKAQLYRCTRARPHFTDYINKLIVNCAYIPSLNMIYCQYKVFSLSFNNVLVVGTSLKKLDFLHSGFGGQTL